MKRLLVLVLSLISVSAFAKKAETTAVVMAQSASCTIKKNTVTFAGAKIGYTLYDKTMTEAKALKCEKVSVNGLTFYTVLFKGEIKVDMHSNKALIYEVALLEKNQLTTVRSEVVDQYQIEGEANGFGLSMKSQWLKSTTDKNVFLKITIMAKDEKPDDSLLKFNPKSVWLEDVFN